MSRNHLCSSLNGSSSVNLRHERTSYRHIRIHAISSRSGGMPGRPFAATIRLQSLQHLFAHPLHLPQRMVGAQLRLHVDLADRLRFPCGFSSHENLSHAAERTSSREHIRTDFFGRLVRSRTAAHEEFHEQIPFRVFVTFTRVSTRRPAPDPTHRGRETYGCRNPPAWRCRERNWNEASSLRAS